MAFYIAAALIAGIMALPLDITAELGVEHGARLRLRVQLAGWTVYYYGDVKRGGSDYELSLRRGEAGRSHTRTLAQLRNGRIPLHLALPAAKAGAVLLMKNVVTRRTALRMRLGVGDAALSALLCGVAGILATALCAAADVRPEIDIRPDYEKALCRMRAEGMFSLRVGHIIGAGLTAIGEYCKGAFMEWKTSKATTR